MVEASWSGTERLWKVFWLYYWLIGTAITFTFETIAKSGELGVMGTSVIALFVGAYLVWITVSLWRCAFNTTWAGWGYLVRIFVILVTLPAALLLLRYFDVA